MGTDIIIEKKEMVQNYQYQDALDLYKDLKPHLNVTDEQYDMHVEAIKEQGTTSGEHEEIVKTIIPWNYNDRPAGFGEAYFNRYNDLYFAINLALPSDWEDYHQGTFKLYIPEDYKFNTLSPINISLKGSPVTATTPSGPNLVEKPIKEGKIYSAKMLKTAPVAFEQSAKFITVFLDSDKDFDLELLKKTFRIDFIEE